MSRWKTFKNSIFTKEGFYAIRRRNQHTDEVGETTFVFAHTPEKHYTNCYSFFTVTPNTRDGPEIGHDFGIYTWVNSYSSACSYNSPTEWREMTDEEIDELKEKLFNFRRPYWAFPTGRESGMHYRFGYVGD